MKTNYHTHTNFCDGKASVFDMVEDAVASGFDILGFSAHAIYPYKSSWHMDCNDYEKYCRVINSFKKEYEKKIEILLGFEADYLPLVSTPEKSRYQSFNPDFIIGSVHYLVNLDNPEKKGYSKDFAHIPINCFAIDGSVEEVKSGIQTLFDGNGKIAVQSYFALEREMASSFNFDIIGHPDIFQKRNSVLNFADCNETWYKNELTETAKVIAKSGKICEVNFGGIARGTMKGTYPSLEFLKILKSFDVPITINSDAHNVGQMNKGYEFAVDQAKQAGYEQTWYLHNGFWNSQPIE